MGVVLATPDPHPLTHVKRAKRAAEGYASGYQRAAQLAVDAGLDDIAGEAYRANLWRIELAAITEAAEAYSAERELILADTLDTYPHLRAQLFKTWDATLDHRTCPVCSAAHGTVVGIDEAFPDGLPGGVHPRCRCIEQILLRDEIDTTQYVGSMIL